MKFFIILLFTAFNNFFSQGVKIPNGLPSQLVTIKTKSFDVSKVNVFYKFVFINDLKEANSKKESLTLLQVGDKFIKFSDFNSIKKDSILKSHVKELVLNEKDINSILKLRDLWPVVSMKDIGNNKIIYQNQARSKYQYEEQQPFLNWVLGNDKKKILGYDCKSATVEYRGRSYLAWYTSEIPINTGPYIFNNLPGLILEINDTSNRFHFLAVEINKNPMDIYLRNEESILEVTRDKFREIQKAYFENPSAFHGKAYNQDGSPIIVKQNSAVYNPMELN